MATQGSAPKIPTYEQMKPHLLKNVDGFESMYYASIARKQGNEGAENGLLATMNAMRTGVGLEGILGNLEAQAMASIQEGDGLNANFSLGKFIGESAKTFMESMGMLKTSDVLSYLKARLGDNVAAEQGYANKTLDELHQNNASDKEKLYGAYLAKQIEHAAFAKVVPEVYQEKAKRLSNSYKLGNLKLK